MNPTAKLFSIALGAMCLAGAAPAQLSMYDNTAEPYLKMAEAERLYWPSGSTPNFKRLVAGDFRADQSLDVAVHAGNAAHLWHDPSFSNLRIELLSSDVLDMDVAAQGAGAPDGLAVVRSTGLFLATLQSNPNLPPVVTAVSTSNPSVWNGALLVRCADFNSDGVTDYVGLASDGLTILRLIGGSGGATDSFVSPNTVRDLGLFMWDLDSDRELAVATSSGMFVHELVGAGAWSPAATYDGGDDCFKMTVLRGTSRDRIAWAVDYALADEIHVVRNGYPLEPVQMALGVEVVGLSGADADGDGDIDIMFNTRQHLAPSFVRNYNPMIPSFATAIAWGPAMVDDDPLLPTLPASNNACPPLFRDFDYDGKADLFLALPQTSSTLDDAPAGVYMPWGHTNANYHLWNYGGILSTATPMAPPQQSTLLRSLDLKLQASVLPAHQGVSANALEVIVYRQEQAYGVLEQSAFAWDLYDLRAFDREDAEQFIRIGIQLANEDSCFESQLNPLETNLYWFELWPRTLDWDANPNDPPVIRNFGRRFIGIGANPYDVCTYLCDEDGVGVLMNETSSSSGLLIDGCSTVPNPHTWGCLSDEGSVGTTEGPAAVIRVRLPVRNTATEIPTAPTVKVGQAY